LVICLERFGEEAPDLQRQTSELAAHHFRPDLQFEPALPLMV
jgi:hypothetical protein